MIRKYLTEEMNISREDHPTIIGVTGHAHDSFKKEGIDAGMDKVEIKPCYFNVINDLV